MKKHLLILTSLMISSYVYADNYTVSCPQINTNGTIVNSGYSYVDDQNQTWTVTFGAPGPASSALDTAADPTYKASRVLYIAGGNCSSSQCLAFICENQPTDSSQPFYYVQYNSNYPATSTCQIGSQSFTCND